MAQLSMTRRRDTERGEGGWKLMVWLVILVYCVVIGFKNLPTYFDAVGLKHDVDEVARSSAAEGINIDRINQRLSQQVFSQHQVATNEVVAKKDGPTVTITVNTVKHYDFLFTKYDSPITQTSTYKFQ